MLSYKRCCTCKKNKPINNFGKDKSKKDGYAIRCRECHRQASAKYQKKIKNLPEYRKFSTYLRNRRREFKQKCIEYKGGKCSICGYNRCNAALDFHHINPTKEDFKIGKGYHILNDKRKKELDKCILICANCHRELHFYE